MMTPRMPQSNRIAKDVTLADDEEHQIRRIQMSNCPKHCV